MECECRELAYAPGRRSIAKAAPRAEGRRHGTRRPGILASSRAESRSRSRRGRSLRRRTGAAFADEERSSKVSTEALSCFSLAGDQLTARICGIRGRTWENAQPRPRARSNGKDLWNIDGRPGPVPGPGQAGTARPDLRDRVRSRRPGPEQQIAIPTSPGERCPPR